VRDTLAQPPDGRLTAYIPFVLVNFEVEVGHGSCSHGHAVMVMLHVQNYLKDIFSVLYVLVVEVVQQAI
jgi:hypothetical protein